MPGWNYSQRLFLNTTPGGADVSGDVYNFPVLVRLTNTNFIFNEAGTKGTDVRFTKTDGSLLPYEIERWDAQLQQAEIWVRVDTIHGNDHVHSITMYWGNANAAVVSNSAAVFDTSNGFQGVWHMNGPNGAAAFDATGNHYDGTPFGSASTAPVSGMAGMAQRFDGASQYFQMAGTASSKLSLPQNGTYAISAWVNADTLDGYFHAIASKGDYQYNLEIVPTDEWEFAEYNDGKGWDMTTYPGQKNTWTYLAGIRSGDKEYLYVNGSLADSSIFLNTSALQRNTGFDFMIGRNRTDANDTTGFFFKGIIDEVRITSVVPSRDWIHLCYMNQKSVDALVEFRP
jgi:hypothetical protein